MESTRSMQADTRVDRRELLDAVDAYLVRYGGDFVPELVSSTSGSRLYTVDGRCILDFTRPHDRAHRLQRHVVHVLQGVG